MCPDGTVARVAIITHSSNSLMGNTNGPSLRACEGRDHRGTGSAVSISQTECGRGKSIHGDDRSAIRPSLPSFRAATSNALEKLGGGFLERKDDCYRIACFLTEAEKAQLQSQGVPPGFEGFTG